jgi:L-lactate utilization protein LutC
MSFFKKFFGTSDESETDENKANYNQLLNNNLSIDERFTTEFKNNGGKFIYCDDLDEVKEQFLNILEENDWFESEVLCFENKLFSMLDENKLTYDKITNPKFLFATCENLIAEEGSVLFSSNQIKQTKPNELPTNIVILGLTSQIMDTKSDGLRDIKRKYNTQYPTNITTIKYFKETKEEDFLHYGSSPKNLYLLLLEDL